MKDLITQIAEVAAQETIESLLMNDVSFASMPADRTMQRLEAELVELIKTYVAMSQPVEAAIEA